MKMELKKIKKLYSYNKGIAFVATSIRTRMYRCLEFFLKSRTVLFFKPLSNSDSCYDLFYSLILSFLMEGHLPFMAPAVQPPLNETEMRISLVVHLFTAALQFQCDIKLVIIAERTTFYK